MTFGKYRGYPLADVPLPYLKWLATCSNITPSLRDEINRILGNEPAVPALPTALIQKWYRRLAAEHHPDAGGSHEGMKAINRAYSLLLEMTGAER